MLAVAVAFATYVRGVRLLRVLHHTWLRPQLAVMFQALWKTTLRGTTVDQEKLDFLKVQQAFFVYGLAPSHHSLVT